MSVEDAPSFVKVWFELYPNEDGYQPHDAEGLWCVPAPLPLHVRIDSIPFFVDDAAVDDQVLCEERDSRLWFVKVVGEGGHSTVRASVEQKDLIPGLVAALSGMGCEVERQGGLLTFDVPPEAEWGRVREHLHEGERDGRWEYWFGAVRHHDRPDAPLPPATASMMMPLRPLNEHTAEFPFSEPPNLGTFVSRLAQEGERIRVVDHDHDGDWIFLTGLEPSNQDGELSIDDLTLVCLQDVAETHPEVRECSDLPVGHRAQYDEDDQRWVREELGRDE